MLIPFQNNSFAFTFVHGSSMYTCIHPSERRYQVLIMQNDRSWSANGQQKNHVYEKNGNLLSKMPSFALKKIWNQMSTSQFYRSKNAADTPNCFQPGNNFLSCITHSISFKLKNRASSRTSSSHIINPSRKDLLFILLASSTASEDTRPMIINDSKEVPPTCQRRSQVSNGAKSICVSFSHPSSKYKT